MNTYIEDLKWRYATKKYDASKKVSAADLETILEAVQLSASSYGLQPYHIFVITDKTLREKLIAFSWGQQQITEASHLIVFANKTSIDGEWIDGYIKNVSDTRNIPFDALSGYGEMMRGSLLNLSTEQQSNWTAKQAYLALGNLLSSAAQLKIDATPMEGFQNEKYNKLLGLNEKGLNAAVIATIGYRSKEDETQHFAKVRQEKNQLFTHL